MTISPEKVWDFTWAKGWSSVVHFSLGGTQYVLVYMGDSGKVNILELDAGGNGATEVWPRSASTSWPAGWTSMVPFSLGGTVYLLSYNATSGAMAISQVNPGAQGAHQVYQKPWTPNWSLMEPFFIDGTPYLLSYKNTTGDVAIDQFNAGGQGTTEKWRRQWAPDWTRFESTYIGGYPYLFSFKTGNLTAAIDRLRSDSAEWTQEKWRAQWETPWTAFAAVALPPHLWSYAAGDGTVAIDEFRDGGNGTDEKWRKPGFLPPNLTHFVPFTTGSSVGGQQSLLRSFCLGYGRSTGKVVIVHVEDFRPSG